MKPPLGGISSGNTCHVMCTTAGVVLGAAQARWGPRPGRSPTVSPAAGVASQAWRPAAPLQASASQVGWGRGLAQVTAGAMPVAPLGEGEDEGTHHCDTGRAKSGGDRDDDADHGGGDGLVGIGL